MTNPTQPTQWLVTVHAGGVKGLWRTARHGSKGAMLMHFHDTASQWQEEGAVRLVDPTGKTVRFHKGKEWKDEWSGLGED